MLRLCTGLIPELETKIPYVAKKKKRFGDPRKGGCVQGTGSWEHIGWDRVCSRGWRDRLDSGGDEP